MNNEVLTYFQAAEKLTISRSTFLKLISEGKIKPIKLSARRMAVMQSEITRYLESLQ